MTTDTPTALELVSAESTPEERMERLEAKPDQAVLATNKIRRQQEMVEELKEDLMPMANGMIHMTSAKLLELEADGSLDDIRELALALPAALVLLKQLTQPEVLALGEGALASLGNAANAKPLGLMGVMGAMKDPDVKKGMGVAIELLRGLGRAAR